MRPDVRFVLAAVVQAALLVAACSDDEPVSTEAAADDTGRQVAADTEWDDALLEADGATLTLTIGSSPPGEGPCAQNFEHEVREDDDRVVIAVDLLPPAPTTSTTAMVACSLMAEPQVIEVTLDEPLGDREVYDGVRSEHRTVWDKGELVTASWLPPGFAADGGPAIGVGHARNGWQQIFQAAGADWYVNVTQAPERSLRCFEHEIGTTTVHGIEAVVCEGMSGTMRTVQWSEGGLDLQVWGEMQGPPTFTHEDELLKVAEGVTLPED